MENSDKPLELYCFGESGNSYKAALTMELAKVVWRPVFVDFFNGETRTPEYRQLNPMGEVPVLVAGDKKLSQSGAIQQYLVLKTGEFGGNTPDEKLEVLRWVLWDNHKMSSIAGTTRFLANFLPAEKRPDEVINWHKGRLRGSLNVLEQRLSESEWLVGDCITIADIACCGYLFYPEPFGFERNEWPGIDRWLSGISSQNGWKHPYDLMPRNR
ncbi:MAG: glutathione S-transferase [Rhodobacteraceae bacterium]|nr:glutathione S-transferase [Paracoccaceae bacterium]MCY4249466.1 glutathione S-transferase [Paracoccaceae bacterium]